MFYFRAKALYNRRKAIYSSKTTCFTLMNNNDIEAFNIILVSFYASEDYKDYDINTQK